MSKPHDRWDLDRNPLTEEDRQKILERIHSSLYWLGKYVPEEETIDGEELPLHDIIFDFVGKENPSEEEVRAALDLADKMQRKARSLETELRTGESMTKGQAHMLLDEICGLLRGVDEVRTSRGADAQLMARTLMSKVNDERRWQDFLRAARYSGDISH